MLFTLYANIIILYIVSVHCKERETPVWSASGYRIPQRDQWPAVRVPRTYGRYYLHLATTLAARGRRSAMADRGVQEPLSLFDYVQSVGMVTDARHRGPRTSGCRTDDRPLPPKDKIILARLPATEYLRGGHCAHADQAVARLRPMQQQACMEPFSIYIYE